MDVVYVNGFQIRQNLDPDFPLIAYHCSDPTFFSPEFFIPQGQYWVDHRFKTEIDFLLDQENGRDVTHKGESYHKRRQEMVEDLAKNKKEIDFKKKEEIVGGFKVFYVDGHLVRQHIDPEYIFGGHDLVYKYIPHGEIWLDILMDPRDIPHVLKHEITERNLMEVGKNYDISHEYATAVERESRRQAGGIYPGDYNYPSSWSKETLIDLFLDLEENKHPYHHSPKLIHYASHL